MKWAWHWTMGSSACKHFTSSNLIQPSSPCCLLLSHAMGLHADLFWLLSLILGWKARQLTRCGQAIEFWVCAQRCVSVGEMTWLRMGCFLALAQEGVNDAKKVENELKEDKDHISVPTCKSATFTFMSCYKHPTGSFFLATLHRPTLELALHLLDRLNAPLLQTPENTPFSTMSSLLHTYSVAHTPKT
jgi:hypothetical protein